MEKVIRDGNVAVIMETGTECNACKKNQGDDQEFIFHDLLIY